MGAGAHGHRHFEVDVSASKRTRLGIGDTRQACGVDERLIAIQDVDFLFKRDVWASPRICFVISTDCILAIPSAIGLAYGHHEIPDPPGKGVVELFFSFCVFSHYSSLIFVILVVIF